MLLGGDGRLRLRSFVPLVAVPCTIGVLLAALTPAALGWREWARALSTGGLLLPALAAAGAAAYRARHLDGPDRRPWLLLAAGATLHAGWFGVLLLSVLRTGHAAPLMRLGDWGLLAATPALAAGLLLLPTSHSEGRSGRRNLLDAAAAALGLAFLACTMVPGAPRGAGRLGAFVGVIHPAADVVLGTVAIGVVARARQPGGLQLGPLLLLTGAVLFTAVTDTVSTTLVQAGNWSAAHPVALGLAAAYVALCLAALTASTEPESEAVLRRREHVAVLAPVLPLVIVTAAAAGFLTAGVAFGLTALVLLGCLLAVVLVGVVLARLDSLLITRTLESRVVERTLALGTRESWFRSLVQNSSDVVTVVDQRGVISYQTPSVTGVFGHDPSVLIGTRFTGLLRPSDARRLEAALADVSRSPRAPLRLEFAVWHRDGRWCDAESTVTSLMDDPHVRGIVLNTRDVSERKQLEQQLTSQAYSDGLTGLPNRALFRERIEQALDGPTRTRVAVLFCDLDGFKSVNDTQGHAVGDQLLGLVGGRLRGCVRPGDTVARLGGDEFGVLVAGPDAEEAAIWVADRVRRQLSTPFVLDGRELQLGVSIGIALTEPAAGDRPATNGDQLLRNADLAMYRAKAQRDLAFVRFESSMHDDLVARVEAETDLRQALRRSELVVHYQPTVELASRQITGVEALVRWQHPTRGLLYPAEFIGLAEETGVIAELGAFVLREACAQGARWQRYAPPGRLFHVAVNISGHQLSGELSRTVHDVLAGAGLPAQALVLEMTESILIERTDDVLGLLRRIKKLGVRLAVDDFGTGYSSLSYLARFPVDVLKIDRSFVEALSRESEEAELVRMIVQLGQTLRLSTVAEGVASQQHEEALRVLGCELAQGYLYGRAVSAGELEAMLSGRLELDAIAPVPMG